MQPTPSTPPSRPTFSATRWGVPWAATGYLVGLAAAVFHFANGLSGFAISWGITGDPRGPAAHGRRLGDRPRPLRLGGGDRPLLRDRLSLLPPGRRRQRRFPARDGLSTRDAAAVATGSLTLRSPDVAPRLLDPKDPEWLRKASLSVRPEGAARRRRRRRARRPHDRDQALRGGRPGRPLLARPRQALALGVRAGRHQRQRQHQGRGRLARRSTSRRRSTAATSSPTSPPSRGWPTRRPGIVFMLDRMGVPFNRTPEGLLDFRRFGGTLFHRTAFAGATTGQQLLYALDEQVRRYETVDSRTTRGARARRADGPEVRVLGLPRLVQDDDGHHAAASSRRT